MTDPARTHIDSALELAGQVNSFTAQVGAQKWDANAAPPAVFVRYGDISHQAAEQAGGHDPSLWVEVQRLVVRILGTDEEEARALKNELLRAFRITSPVPAGLDPGQWRWLSHDDPGFSRFGAALFGTIAIRVPVPATASDQQYATVKTVAHTAEFNDG